MASTGAKLNKRQLVGSLKIESGFRIPRFIRAGSQDFSPTLRQPSTSRDHKGAVSKYKDCFCQLRRPASASMFC